MKKESGIILHIASLPSIEPIGNLGQEAKEFIEFLNNSRMDIWQILPLNPVDRVWSPYSPASAFAGEPLYIDIKSLDDSALVREYLNQIEKSHKGENIDYSLATSLKIPILRKYFQKRRFDPEFQSELTNFMTYNSWVEDYGLFTALQSYFDMDPWWKWPEEIKFRNGLALENYKLKLSDEIDFSIFLQYMFFKQMQVLREKAKEKNVKIIGDIPIYVPLNSADVWINPQLFMLDDQMQPLWVSGAPPDGFSEGGQKWDTPVYDWLEHKKENYEWWKNRISNAFKLYDILRLDHFRGFEAFWAVKPDAEDARDGIWMKGPAEDFIIEIKENFNDNSFLVEDLGLITPEVLSMKKVFGFPGMKVLQFAFDSNPFNPHLPFDDNKADAVYTGTHDNPPLPLWEKDLNQMETNTILDYLSEHKIEVKGLSLSQALIRAAFNADAPMSIIQFQDLLEPKKGLRMNIPGTTVGNWIFKADPNVNMKDLTEIIIKLKEPRG
ncbi:4-alpha-glucanotransferase [Alkalibacter mobilis]|uniref:4-alpha-glucanotransferase n=1 Tax=Alkalibacter mobilis TaxID=2787712 RepID=UPI00189CD8A6|nr:4-alpha-glucanotransferase [Alkalibacter mobilis]MBF7095742.1 4-alpha-glucanotransferase [Alkalibacter mobilis]